MWKKLKTIQCHNCWWYQNMSPKHASSIARNGERRDLVQKQTEYSGARPGKLKKRCLKDTSSCDRNSKTCMCWRSLLWMDSSPINCQTQFLASHKNQIIFFIKTNMAEWRGSNAMVCFKVFAPRTKENHIKSHSGQPVHHLLRHMHILNNSYTIILLLHLL